MVRSDFRAIYIHCDGSMMYDKDSSGGTGYVIKFPDFLGLEDVTNFDGIYVDSNIERLELEGITNGMEGLRDYLKTNEPNISRVSQIIVITDRFALKDDERTSPYRIRDWRSNGGKNHENKEIKNWDLINKLDKTRTKLSNEARKIVRIEYRKRKFNKEADKLSKRGRNEGIASRKISIEGHKIGRRKFDGREINYKLFSPKEKINIHIFRKRLIKDQWEINAEICSEKKHGGTLKIITDYELQDKLQRGNEYEITIKMVYNYHFEIYRTIKKFQKK